MPKPTYKIILTPDPGNKISINWNNPKTTLLKASINDTTITPKYEIILPSGFPPAN